MRAVFSLQENVELMTKRVVPLENRDEDTNLSDVQQVMASFPLDTDFLKPFALCFRKCKSATAFCVCVYFVARD